MNARFLNVEVKGNRLTISRDDLALRLETCIDMQKESKMKNDFTQWLLAAGYIEAIKDLLGHFEIEN